jgi:hypothetical protein
MYKVVILLLILVEDQIKLILFGNARLARLAIGYNKMLHLQLRLILQLEELVLKI